MDAGVIVAIIVIVLIAIILLVIFVFPSEKITEIRISPVTKFTKDEATNNLAKANQEKLLQVYDFAKLNNIPVVPKVFSSGYINWVTNKGSDKTIEFTETFLIHGYLQALHDMGNVIKPGSMPELASSYDSKLVL
jgi:hypothetical protein